MPDASPLTTAGVDTPAWLKPVSYWLPERYVVSAWHEHAPFAFWLMEAARPRVLAELGTHHGFSFFVFAEAAERLGLDTQLFALDSWEGDDQAGFYGDEVFESVQTVVNDSYSHVAHLVRGYFDSSVDTFEDNSIDLLHVDGRHGYEDVSHDFETFRPKLSDRAVVLFHDTFEFQKDFGVNQFWTELSADFPSFNFEHGHGLGVLAFGVNAPTAVLDFIRQAKVQPDKVRKDYATLGAAVSRQFVLEVDHFALIHHLRLQIIDQQQQIARLAIELELVHNSVSWKLTSLFRALHAKTRARR